MTKQPFPFCIPVFLSPEQEIKAIKVAVDINPANAIPAALPKPGHLAVLRSRYWGAKGVDLTVSFLDNPDQATINKILEAANDWGKKANVKFRYTKSGGQVRIAREPGDGYWSYLGTDILGIPKNEPTMNLDSFTSRTPTSEYNRVVKHEFGHTLGFPHEHVRRQIVERIDKQKCYAYFKKHIGWSKAMVDSQVLTPLEESSLIATKNAKVDSIMCYQLPGAIMIDGRDVPGGNDISTYDRHLCRKIYPKFTTD